MTRNRWLRRLAVLGFATLAISGMLAGSSSSQDADDQEGIAREKPNVGAAQAAQTLTITITAAENGQMGATLQCHAILISNRVHAIDTDQQHVFDLAALTGVVIGPNRYRVKRTEQSQTQCRNNNSKFQIYSPF